MSRNDDIKDNEFRVIGKGPDTGTDSGKGRKPWRGWIVVAAVVMLLAGAGALYLYQHQYAIVTEPEVVFEPLPEKDEEVKGITETPVPLCNQKDSTSYTEHLEIDINDITLDIYIPHHGIPSLSVGAPDINDGSVILATQAADIRADNGKIVGAFVLKGKPLSWGLSKKGFCGIIDGEITVGVADNSPLFEKATETGGYFFRQFPLVDNGQLVENEYKGKAVFGGAISVNGAMEQSAPSESSTAKKAYYNPGKERSKLEKKVKRAEEELAVKEEELEKLKEELLRPEYQSSYSKLSEIQAAIDAKEEEIMLDMETWEELSSQLEEMM